MKNHIYFKSTLERILLKKLFSIQLIWSIFRELIFIFNFILLIFPYIFIHFFLLLLLNMMMKKRSSKK